MGMKFDVGRGALGDAEQGMPNLGRDGTGLAGDLHKDVVQVLLGRPLQGFEKGRSFEARHRELVHEAPGVGKVPAEEAGCSVDFVVRRGIRPGTLGCLEEEQAAREALGDGVVDFTGNTLAFRRDSRFPFTRGQLFLRLAYIFEELSLEGAVALNLVVNQREQGPRSERSEQHGDVRPATHAEKPDGGGRCRRAARQIRGPPTERGAAEEENGEGAPCEAWRRDDQSSP